MIEQFNLAFFVICLFVFFGGFSNLDKHMHSWLIQTFSLVGLKSSLLCLQLSNMLERAVKDSVRSVFMLLPPLSIFCCVVYE